MILVDFVSLCNNRRENAVQANNYYREIDSF